MSLVPLLPAVSSDLKTWIPGIVLLSFSLLLRGQNADPPTFRSEVNLVSVVCTVTDRQGQPVLGLTRSDFALFIDNQPQPIESFLEVRRSGEHPLNIVIAMDTSDSVEEKLHFEQQAVVEFLKNTLKPPADEAAILQFGTEVKLLNPFSSVLERLELAVYDSRAEGTTRLYDAVWLATSELLTNRKGRRVLVILSDGNDNFSEMTREDALRASLETETIIFGIGVQVSGFEADFSILKDLSAQTGGLFLNSRADLNRLKATLERIRRLLESQYILSFSQHPQGGESHQIRIRIPGKRHQLSYRRRYFANRP